MDNRFSLLINTPSTGKVIYRKRFSRRRNLWLSCGSIIAILLLLNSIAPAIATQSQRILASSILCVCSLPTLVFFLRGESNVPFLPCWGILYGIYFASPVFLLDDYTFRDRGSAEGITASLWIALVGASLLIVTFYKLPTRVGKLIPHLSFELQPSRTRVLAIAIGLIGVSVTLAVNPQSNPSFAAVLNLVSRSSVLGIGALYVLHLRGQLDLVSKLFLWAVLLPIVLLLDLGTGLLLLPLRDLLVLIFIYWKVRQKAPIKTIILLALIFSPLIAVKQQFRDTAWYGSGANATVIEKAVSYISLTNQQLMKDSGETFASSLDRTIKRVAQLQTLTVVVEDTPELVPYWNGETYKTLFTIFIPRFLWPDKPEKTLGQDFGHRYNILDDHDLSTSWNFPQLVELYANFGWIGIIIGMPLIGLIYRIFYEIFNHPHAGDGGAVISAIIFTGFINIESDFSLVFGGVIQTCILYVIMLRFIGNSTQINRISQRPHKTS